MLKIKFSPKEKERLHHERFHHPDPSVQLKMEVIYLKSQGVKPKEIERMCKISKATYHRYLKEYFTGGIERLKKLRTSSKKSELEQYKGTLENYFLANPPATASQAQAKIAELTGIRRGLTQVRLFLHSGCNPIISDINDTIRYA
jgi:transposase